MLFDMEEAVETGLSPGVLALLALLAVGGLLFVGWEADVTGEAFLEPYGACCTLRSWMYSREGEKLATPITSSELCYPTESPTNCCRRVGSDYPEYYPVKVLDAKAGTCDSPELSYPAAGEFNAFSACCTVEVRRNAPTGTIQSTAQTTGETCGPLETPNECCARAASSRTNFPIRVLGSKRGGCLSPEVGYPAPISLQARTPAYAVCCTMQTWRNAPTGYAQGTAESNTGYCDELETPGQCCARTSADISNYPFKLIGFKHGACAAPPEISYPIWIR